MKQTVLDSIVAIEERAAKLVEDAKRQAAGARAKVKAELEALDRQLEEAAKLEVAKYKAEAEARKAEALAALDQRLAEAQAALARVRDQRLSAAIADVLKLLEQRGAHNPSRPVPAEGQADGN